MGGGGEGRGEGRTKSVVEFTGDHALPIGMAEVSRTTNVWRRGYLRLHQRWW